MKRSEMRRMVSEYNDIVTREAGGRGNPRLADRRKEIEQRYRHETGQEIWEAAGGG